MVFTLTIWIFKEEGSAPENTNTLAETYQLFQGYIKNRNLYYIVCVMICWKSGFMAVEAIYEIRILKDGFPKEYFVVIQALLIPISIVVANYLGIVAGPGKELTLFYHGLYWKFVSTFFYFCIMEGYA
jgi:hypothetical protein